MTATPSPDYLVRAALAWCRNNGRLKPSMLAMLDDLHPTAAQGTFKGVALCGTFQGTDISVCIIRSRDESRRESVWLSIRCDYAPDLRATHDYLLPREFSQEAQSEPVHDIEGRYMGDIGELLGRR